MWCVLCLLHQEGALKSEEELDHENKHQQFYSKIILDLLNVLVETLIQDKQHKKLKGMGKDYEEYAKMIG